MIILTSDYSPEVAPELQERENIKMVYAALHCAGLSCVKLQTYRDISGAAAEAFNFALGEPDENGWHSPEQWEAARAAAKTHIDRSQQILIDAGITMENVLYAPDDPEHEFHSIRTTVYTSEAAMIEACRIDRPVIDIEAEGYADNVIGWGAANPGKAEAYQKELKAHSDALEKAAADSPDVVGPY